MLVVLAKESADFREWLFGSDDKFQTTIAWLDKMYKSTSIAEPLTKDASNGQFQQKN